MEAEKNKKLVIPSLFICLILFIAGCLYWCGMRYKISSNAFIEGGHPISIASRIDGQVKEVYAQNNQPVKTNSVIIEFESANYQNNFDKRSSRQNELKLKLNSQKKLFSGVKSNFDTNSKSYEILKSKLKSAEVEYTKSAEMYKEGILSKQDYDKELLELTALQAKFKESEEAFRSAEKKYTALNNDIKYLEAELKKLDLELAQAKYNLTNTKVFAPEDGMIADLVVKKGDSLKASQVFMTLIPQKVWVVATYKESQLSAIENGQAVWIKLESVSNKKLKGHIDSIIPEDGNVTVKVLFDENIEDYDIRPGKSVVLKLRERG